MTAKDLTKRRKLSIKRSTSQTILATAIGGITLTFILLGRDPGWQPFLAAMLVAVGYLLTSLLMWRGSTLLGVLAMAVLILAMLWDPERPWGALLGLAITALNILNSVAESEGEQRQDIEVDPDVIPTMKVPYYPPVEDRETPHPIPPNINETGGPIEGGGPLRPPADRGDSSS